MKQRFLFVFLVLVCLATLFPAGVAAFGQSPAAEGGDKSLSPYFMIQSDDPKVDRLPLKATEAKVRIAGIIADVTVTQVYENQGTRPIEAVYVFPASTRAAVYGLKMIIADRTITAVIKKKEEARADYEEARRQGKSASLLEQHRPNVFSMSVANILPKDVITVEMRYTELLVPTAGVYEFVYPTVVGPRYSSAQEAAAPNPPSWNNNPYLPEGEESQTTFDLKLSLSAGLPIQAVSCDTHKSQISWNGKQEVDLSLDPVEKHGGNRDFIFQYRLTGEQIESGLLLTEGDTENFFLMMVQPPKSVDPKAIPPREFVFVIDISGSMHGFPLDTAKAMMQKLLKGLRDQDSFNVLLFSGSSRTLSDRPIPATPAQIENAMNLISRQRGGGGTELVPALKRALELPGRDGVARVFVVITDGYVSVEHEAFNLIRENLGNASLFAFGIGRSVNRYLIEGLARAGMGEPLIITEPKEAEMTAEKFRQYIESPVLTDIEVNYGDFEVKSVEPPRVPDVMAERPVIVFGQWKGKPAGTITVTGKTGAGDFSQSFNIADAAPKPENAALRYLWARHRIAVLADHNRLRSDPEIVTEVTSLGLKYGLLTDYTSFVAVDTLVRTDAQSQLVNQPLPLPQGVSDLATGRMQKSLSIAPESRMRSERFDSLERETGPTGAMPMRSPMPAVVPPSPPNFGATKKTESDGNLQMAGKAPDVGDKTKSLGKALPRVRIESLMLSGDMSAEDVRTRLAHAVEKIRQLVGSFPADKRPSGKLTLELTLDATGAVTACSIDHDTLQQEELVKNIVETIKTARFAADQTRQTRTITLTLVI